MPLEAIAHALPSLRQDTAEVARQTGAEIDFLTGKVGMRERYVLGPGETGVSLAAQACRTLFDREALDPRSIDLLVFVTQNPDRKLPQNSAQLAHALGLHASLASFDLALGCSGYVYGLAVTESFLASTGGETALLVTCDPYSRIMASEDKATNAVFGDAATVTLVRREGRGGRLLRCDFGTDGGGGDAIAIAGGGAASPLVALGLDGPVEVLSRDDLRLTMNGRAVFEFVMTRVTQSIAACLAANDLTLDAIDHFALHQGSLYMLQMLARRAGIPGDKLLINIDRYGNTVSSTIPLLLEPVLGAGELAGKRVLVSGFGVGLSWATSVVEF